MQTQITLHPTQIQVAQDTHRFRVLCNGRRWGKTFLAIEEMKAKLISRQTRVCYIGPTYQQARDNCWERLVKELLPATVSVNESRLEIKVRNSANTESICILRGWESIETLRGQYFDFIVIDEVAMMREFWVSWNNVVSPTLTDKKGEVLFISTPQGFNHFYELYNMHEKDKDFTSFHFTSYDNPNVPKEEIDRQAIALPPDAFAQEYLADFRKRTGLVYPEFDRSKHLFDDDTPRAQTIMRLLGEDFGYTNPTALILVEKDSDDSYWVTFEWYKRGKTNTEVTEYVKTLNVNKVYPDPAEPDRIEEQRRMGINVQEVSKDIEKGIDSVRELLKANRLHIHKDCVNLISEFEMYHYEEKRPNKNEPERPVKEDDHGLDALRYVLHNTKSHEKRRAYTFVPDHVKPSMTAVMKGVPMKKKSFPLNYTPVRPRQ